MEGEKQRRMAKIWVRGFKIWAAKLLCNTYIQDDDHYLTKRVVCYVINQLIRKKTFLAQSGRLPWNALAPM